ncbi:MAG: DNA polymerase III subunit gamma/tau [Bacteroidaceae bacterium]|nr:DNA polymerase III subunit gamma/tau [Bacteroidaceae bacterium]
MDNYIVSARKYRPSTFQSVVGQKSLTQTLKNAIDAGKLAHAYLFCGPRGVGKTSCARIFAKTINCLHPTSSGEACNECESCRAFNEQRSYNISELDAASNNSVDDIRQLVDQVRIPPQIGRYKVYIVDEVHMLSTAAFNAFLKTLEEPPHHAIFILATTEKHKILPTILSRCQVYDFHRITIADIAEHLLYVATQEGIKAEAEALSVIAQKADGGMRDALSIFDQIASFTAGNITYNSVIENLNVLDYEYYFRLTEAFLSANVSSALLLYKEICDKGFESQHFISGLSNHFRNLLVSKDIATLSLLEMGEATAKRYGEQAAKCDIRLLYKAMDLSNRCDLDYRVSNNKRFLVELMLIQICQLSMPTEPVEPKPQLQPIKNTSQHTATVAQPSASAVKPTTQAQPAPAPTPQNQRLSAQAYAPRSATPKPVAPRTGMPAPAIRINAIKTEQTTEREKRKKPFTQDALVAAWLKYANTIPDEVALFNTMQSHQPTLKGEIICKVEVESTIQQSLILVTKDALLDFIHNELENDYIDLETEIKVSNERRVSYSTGEILAAMKEDNPNLIKAVDMLHLEIE